MKLYYSPASPYSRKVMTVAHGLGVALNLEVTNPLHPEGDYCRINPINRVPSLELDDGMVLFDSRVICEYLDHTYGPIFFPTNAEARWQALRRQALGDGIMDAAVPRRQELLRPDHNQSRERLYLYQRSIRQILDYLENAAETLPAGDIGAVSIACALQYLDFRFPEEHWDYGRPALSRWYAHQVRMRLSLR